MMGKELGLWIDHREALIAMASKDEQDVIRVDSGIDKHTRFVGGASRITEEDIQDRRFANLLHRYYDDVIARIRDADSILILGPGEAKTELKTLLESQHLGGRIVGVEAADKLTDKQVIAKVREHFLVN
jgi:stalled ribosome rescue protein Dom34